MGSNDFHGKESCGLVVDTGHAGFVGLQGFTGSPDEKLATCVVRTYILYFHAFAFEVGHSEFVECYIFECSDFTAFKNTCDTGSDCTLCGSAESYSYCGCEKSKFFHDENNLEV